MAADQAGKARLTSVAARADKLLEILYQSSKPLATAELARLSKLETAQVHAALAEPLDGRLVRRRRLTGRASTTALNGEARTVQRPEVLWSLTAKGRTREALRSTDAARAPQ